MIDYLLLVATILIVVAVLLYLFFWNKFIGYIISVGFRVAYWNKGGESIYVHIGSIHFSLLAGRVLFKDLHYHSASQTIKVVKGQVSWRYWIRAPTLEEDLQECTVGEDVQAKLGIRQSSCRVHATFEGFEWFLYNRTAAFDDILSGMQAKAPGPRAPSTDNNAPSTLRHIFSKSSAAAETDLLYPPTSRPRIRTPDFLGNFVQKIKEQLPNLDPKSLLPVSFEGTKGAIICGNMSTKSLFVAEFNLAEGIFGTVPAKSPLDLYKQVLNVKFQNATFSMVANDQYIEPMMTTGEHIKKQINKSHSYATRSLYFLLYHSFTKLWLPAGLDRLLASLRDAAKMQRKTTMTPMSSFRSRRKRAESIDMETPVHADYTHVDYVVERKILEAPVVEMSYYLDAVGVVPPEQQPMDLEGCDIGNGGVSPEWGLDLVVHGGFIRYGPWADRQRTELHRAFFPPNYQEGEQTSRLSPGDNRMWTAMRIFVELRGGTTVHIPFREPSKDWMWDGVSKVSRPRKREGASLSIKAGDDSTISYLLPFVAGPDGYHPLLEVHLDTVTISSSLNDIRLLTAESCRVSGNMHSPLKWNEHREWRFAISLRQPVLYLLRDHINMLTDLGKDWSSGPPSDYYTWVPMRYVIDVDMRNYEINTYVNDHNIIDKPLIRDENAILTLRGPSLRNESVLSSDKFRPISTTVPFSLEAPDVTISLTLPKWSSHRIQDMEPITKLLKIGNFRLDGSYLYFSEVLEDNVEQLRLNFHGNDVAFKCLGWSIRHFMILRENYFGTFTHFSTLREYLEKREKGLVGDPIDQKYRVGKSNQLQVELQLAIARFTIVLPCGLPGYETYTPLPDQKSDDTDLGGCVTLAVPEMELQLRSHEYAMEMSLNIGTAYGSIDAHSTEKSIFQNPKWMPDKEVFIIDKLDIVANRLFGPQPHTATYVCIWEIGVGDVKGALTAPEYSSLMVAFDVLGVNYRDPLNSPALEFVIPSDPDVTFLKVTLGCVDLIWSSARVAIQTLIPRGFRVELNDLAGNNYRKVTSIKLPELIIRFLHTSGTGNRWIEAGEITADVVLDLYACPPGWQDSALAQAKFMAEQDAITGRLNIMNKDGKRFPPPSSGLYTSALKLPRPIHRRRPSLSNGRPAADNETQDFDNGELTKPTPFSHRGPYMSDSDGEDTYAEPDRDLRLARSRPTSMLPKLEVDSESMASGDESDNADLTEEEGFDSEWSDDQSRTSGQSLYSQYSRHSRHYALHTSMRPSLWDASPVNMIRDLRPSAHFYSSSAGHLDPNDRKSPFEWHAQPGNDDHDSTSVRLQTQSVSFWATPILPSTLFQVVEEHSNAFMGSEQRIDTLLTKRIKRLLAPSGTVEDTLFGARILSLRIQVVQLVPATFQEDIHESLQVPSVAESSNHELTAFEFSLSDSEFKGQILGQGSSNSRSFTGSIGNLAFALNKGYSNAPRKDNSTGGPAAVMDMSLSRSHFSLSPTKADVSWGAFVVEMKPIAADYALAVFSAHKDSLSQVSQAYQGLRRDRVAAARLRLHHILMWSREHSVVDPLSTIQPSYLIQTGRPHDLRINAGVKVMIYLRICLRSMDPRQRQAVREIRSSDGLTVSREDLIRLLEHQLTGLLPEGDPGALADTDLLTELYPVSSREDVAGKANGLPSIEAFTCGFQSTKLSISDPAGSLPAEVNIGAISVTAVVQKSILLPSRPTKATKDLTNSSRGKTRQKLQHLMLSVMLESVDVLVLPHVLNFAQRILRLRHGLDTNFSDPAKYSPRSPPRLFPSMDGLYCDVTVSLNHMLLQAAAEKLILAFSISRLAFVSSAFIRFPTSPQGRMDVSSNSSVVIDAMSLGAHTCNVASGPAAQDALAVIIVKRVQSNAVFRQEAALSSTIRAFLALEDLRFSVPRSAIRLSRFIEEWRADYLPGIEQTIQTLISEVRQEPKVQSSPVSMQRRFSTIHVQLSLTSCGVFLHVMPGTWLSWEAFDIITYLRLGVTNSRKVVPTFGIQLSSQRISITSMSTEGVEPSVTERLKLDLPSITVTGRYEDRGVHVMALIGVFHVTVKPSYWDTLLSVQQKFGQDFNDLLHFLADARNKRPVPTKSKEAKPPRFILHSGLLKVKGFLIGLEGHSSTVFLQCQDINGEMKAGSGRDWHMNVTGLALSLAPRAYASSNTVVFNGNHRSAFVIIDFKGDIHHRRNGDNDVKVLVNKAHAVLQPSSIGEIGDFIDHIQAEVLVRQDERARELAAFKEKTRNVMRTFEVKTKEGPNSDSHLAWFSNYSMKFDIKNIGAAFPLEFDGNLELPRGVHKHKELPAFLFSIKSVEFGSERDGNGQFKMFGFSFQFVNKFKQSTPSDFAGDNHHTRNRLLYPTMTASIRTERSITSRRIRIGANVDGFILDLDSSITDHIFSLIDVYRRGKERVDRLTANAPRRTVVQELKPKLEAIAAERQEKALPTSSMLLSLVFESGSVRMHSGSVLPRSSSLHDIKDTRISTAAAESFNLPVVSVWGEYRAASISRKLSGGKDGEPASVMFKSTVHSSENTLRPTLLPFVSELVSHVEVRMRKASSKDRSAESSTARELVSSVPVELYPSDRASPASSMNITFALRIDQSKLQLTCQPDVNVIAGIHWDSGGFVVNISSHARQVSFVGHVAGLTIGLKHGFLSEDCVRLDARNLTFSTTFAKHDQGSDITTNSVSVVVDTEISGGVRFSRLQDVLCFKAVWLDRIPIFVGGNTPATPNPSKNPASLTPGGITPTKQGLTTAVLVRIRKVALNVDLGQSISSVTLDMEHAVLRSKLEEAAAELSLSVAELRIKAAGNISGDAHIPDFSFQTVRRKNLSSKDISEPRMLDMSLTSGALDLTLESDYQKILHFWAEPLTVDVIDDWSQMSPNIPVLERLLRLSFIVSGSEVVAIATVGTLPKLVSYAAKFKANLEIQKEGASRESKAFRITQSPKPDNPLSAFANAMLHSARTRLREKEDNLSYVVQQQMKFRLKLLRLAVFPRTMTDIEMAHFVARDLRANLDRIVESDAVPAKRKLQLAFSSMSTSRSSQLNIAPDSAFKDRKEWFEALRKDAPESTIFELPAMDMLMESEETDGGGQKTIEYSFVSKFARGDNIRSQDDIYITLNVSLYSWLTILRKNLAREMDQAQGTMDWRTNFTPAVSSSPRKKSNTDASPPPEFALREGVVSPVSRPRTPTISIDTRFPSLSMSPVEHKKAMSMSGTRTPTGPPALGPAFDLVKSPKTNAAVAKSATVSPASPMGPSSSVSGPSGKQSEIVYKARHRHIERLNMRQLGEATPDVMHPFFMKKAGFNLEDALPQYVHEYATMPIEEITTALLRLYSKQLSSSGQV